ncbi:MAG: DUF4440 domain-containing protein [Crocinitomicaceae bacterium]
MKKRTILFTLLLLSTTTFAQEERTTELYKAIHVQDSLLFQVGFNTCDIQQFENLVSENFEFFHDQSGITDSKAAFILSIKNGICQLPYQAKRVLDEKTMEVYPLEKGGVLYGVIQTGMHLFYAIETDKPETLTSVAKFTHVWLLEKGEFKLSKVLSYDHNNAF